ELGSLGGTPVADGFQAIPLPFVGTGDHYRFSEVRTPTATTLTLASTAALGQPLVLHADVTENLAAALASLLGDDGATLTLLRGDEVLAVLSLKPGDLGS